MTPTRCARCGLLPWPYDEPPPLCDECRYEERHAPHPDKHTAELWPEEEA